MLAMCILWNANNPWISLAKLSVATLPTAHPSTRWLFPSWQGGWPRRALDLYEPLVLGFEQLGLGLYRPWLLEMGFEKTLGLSLFFLCKNQRDGSGEMPAISVGYVVKVTGRALSWRMPEHQEKTACLWSWATDENCSILKEPCTAEETGESLLWGTSWKKGSCCAVLNDMGVSLQPFLLSTCTYFSEGFWREMNNFSPCLDVLLSKDFQMWTHFRQVLHHHHCFSREHLKRGNLICSRSAQWIRTSCSALGVHCTPQDLHNLPFGASSWVVL